MIAPKPRTKARGDLVHGNDPRLLYPIPDIERFKSEDGGELDFVDAPDLQQIGWALINFYPAKFAHLQDTNLIYLWKREGGEKAKRSTLSMCIKPSGVLQYFSGADFVIWLAADHCRDYRLTAHQIEALVFHELLHAWVDDKGKRAVIGHDWEGFTAEIDEYGLWLGDLDKVAQSMMQLQMFEPGPAR